MTKETRHVKRRVADETYHDTVITDMTRCFRKSRRTGAPTSKFARSPTLPTADVPAAAPTPPEVLQESARDITVLTNFRKAHSAYDKCQRDANSVTAKSTECSTTVERDLRIALVKWRKARSRAHVVGSAGITRRPTE